MYIPKSLRKQVYDKYNGKCGYSGTILKDDWQVDHVIPICVFKYLDKNPNDIDNLIPTQKIINHYKRSLSIEEFRNWYLGELHIRLRKLPKNPKVEKSIKHKKYMLEIANYFDISEDKPFDRKFYYEKIK